jgi:hypothetical protein
MTSSCCTSTLPVLFGPGAYTDLDMYVPYDRAHEKSNAYDGSFVHFAPDRICRTYTPLPSDWSSYFSSAAPQLMAAPPALLRCHTSHQLSLPLTLIAALERFSLASRYSDPR